MLAPREKFINGRAYTTESTHLLNRIRGIRDKLNSMYAIGFDERRDMATILYLLEKSMVELNPEGV